MPSIENGSWSIDSVVAAHRSNGRRPEFVQSSARYASSRWARLEKMSVWSRYWFRCCTRSRGISAASKLMKRSVPKGKWLSEPCVSSAVCSPEASSNHFLVSTETSAEISAEMSAKISSEVSMHAFPL